eukprot:TRINITY_DN2641_c0_g1_i1.p1 TRINITY_DN2641_c0_g1~~TRINITY_DN2641_c0_g1_i1.p1  ORF type:complete len:249 (+),score=78.44 TRINITY_DN2641_c0_g1_i1:156-902(+)
MSGKTIGMMEGAFFVSRGELLRWLNELTGLGYTKVEQVCSGAAYCMIIDSVHPGNVAMKKINFNARQEHEYVPNYKVLQVALNRVGIDKHVNVGMLIKGRYQDNLEMLQWFKRYWDVNNNGEPYNPSVGGRPATSSRSAAATRKRAPAKAVRDVTNTASRSAAPKPAAAKKENARQVDSASAAKLLESQKMVAEMRLAMEQLEQERDFYFNKLREVEIYCQTFEDQENPAVMAISSIMYADADADAEE